MSRMNGILPSPGRFAMTVVAAVAVVLGACSAGGQPTAGATAGTPATGAGPTHLAASAGATEAPGAQTTTSAAPTPRPTEVPGPPRAYIAGGSDGVVPGEIGAFTWDGLGSDAPWIVPSGSLPVVAGVPITVTLDPALAPERWAARWAPVVAGSAGDPAAVQSGTDAAIEVALPVAPGTWGLQVEVTFAEGRRAAWYWSIDVAP
jgi:hypothetical protein